MTDRRPVGFLTDATLCIGCKACEVACKQWNQLPADGFALTGHSYDNTGDLGADTWRHVAFVETDRGVDLVGSLLEQGSTPRQTAWLMVSDVCKHCAHAGCMEACPTGAIIRTEFGTVVIQQDICNGCGYCIPSCPFGVPQISHVDHKVHKCTLCYDRLVEGLEPACAKACPTDSIQFGYVDELRERGYQRVETLKARGVEDASLYGDAELGGTHGIGGLHAMFVLNAPPETYNLPAAPSLPQDRVLPAYATTAAMAIGLALAAVRAFKSSG